MSSATRMVSALVLILMAYALSTSVTSMAVDQLYGISCSQSFLTNQCRLPNDVPLAASAYAGLGIFIALVFGCALTIWRKSAGFMFILLLCIFGGAAVMVDLASGRPVMNSPKIVNDTFNVLSAVMASSFALLLIIIRKEDYSLPRLAGALALSFSIKIVTILAFIPAREGVYGVTELFLLYVVYAFGGFTAHLMTVSSFVASLKIKFEGQPA